MKESLAARQAALLRQNAELDEKVEAIEQRRQQQQLLAGASKPATATTVKRSAAGADMFASMESDDAIRVDMESDSEQDIAHDADVTASIDSLADACAPVDPAVETPLSVKHAKSTRRGAPAVRLDRKRSAGNVSAVTFTSQQLPARKSDLAAHPGAVSHGSDNTTTVETSSSNKRLQGDKRGGEGDAETEETDGLGLEATVRYQKARLRVLQDELDAATSELKEMQGTQTMQKARIEELTNESATLKKKHQQTQQLLEKQQELSAAQESKQKILETQLAAAQAKIEEIQRAEKQASQQFRSKDVRLNRALEELEKVKSQLQEERRTQGEQMIAKGEYEQVLKENKKLEKQKNELLLAFKKQMKLIDLLKRQRIHMEAAKMLSFTEEEFSKTLELG